jgi:hypothetical protein
MYDGIDYLQEDKDRKPTRYAIKIARKLWGEELCNGIIEPGRKLESDRVILEGEKLTLLKSK